MCLIIYSGGKDNPIPGYLLRDAFKKNSDGWGIMFSDHRGLVVFRGYRLDMLIKMTKFLRKYTKGDMFIHLRKKTIGDVCHDNIHPILINPRVAMMHNGTILGLHPQEGESDTRALARKLSHLTQKYGDDILFDPIVEELLLKYIGKSRLVLLMDSGQFKIITDRPWVSYKGLLLSNKYAWSYEKYTGHLLSGGNVECLTKSLMKG